MGELERLKSRTRSASALIVTSSVLPMLIDLSNRFRFVDQLQQRVHDIGDVREGPRLGAVAEHGDRLAGERLPDEVRNHHSVRPVCRGPTVLKKRTMITGSLRSFQ